MNPKRIGILTSSLGVGGAERMALRLLDLLERNGNDVFLLTIDGTKEMDLHEDSQRNLHLQSRLIRLSRSNINASTARKIVIAPRQYIALQSAISRLNLNLVISFEDRANIFNMLSVRGRYRVVCVRHPMVSLGSLKAPVKRALVKWLFTLGIRRVTEANFNSTEAMLEFKQHFHVQDGKLSVIPNFCDHGQLTAEASANSVPGEYEELFRHRTVLACGRLRAVKGFQHLIRMFKRVHDQCPDARLLIIGDGPCRKELVQLTADLCLSEAVIFVGYQKSPLPWMSRADLLVLTSLSEGFPNVLLEAMALRTPVVAADCISGPREILAPGSDCRIKTQSVEFAEFGVLTPPMSGARNTGSNPLDSSEEAMAESVIRLLTDDRLRQEYSVQAYRRSLDFSAERQKQMWVGLIERLGHACDDDRRQDSRSATVSSA